MAGQTINDRLLAARHSLAGQGLAKSVCKATTEEMIGPKKKHLDYLVHCTNEPNVSIPHLANLLVERSQNTNWVVVYKSLITVHHLLAYGNERFMQYLASSNSTFNLSNFLDKGGVQGAVGARIGYDMSPFIRRYAKYLNEKALSYRTVAFDFCKVKRGKEEGSLRTMNTDKLLKTLPVLQAQLDALLEFDCTSNDLTNGVINMCFMLLFRDLIRLFACYNDGIINLLEKYFDMNKKQARDALDLYKKFLVRMDRVGEFLKVAENVGIDKGDIPDLTKAPSSLLDALEQHLASLEGKKGSAANTPTQTASNQKNVKSGVSALSSTSSSFGTAAASARFEAHANGIDEELKAQALAEEEAAMNQYKSKLGSPTSGNGMASTNPFLSSPPAGHGGGGAPIVDLFGSPTGDIKSSDGLAAGQTKASDDLLQLGNPFADIFGGPAPGQQQASAVPVNNNVWMSNGFNGAAAPTASLTTTSTNSNTFVSESNFSSVFGSADPTELYYLQAATDASMPNPFLLTDSGAAGPQMHPMTVQQSGDLFSGSMQQDLNSTVIGGGGGGGDGCSVSSNLHGTNLKMLTTTNKPGPPMRPPPPHSGVTSLVSSPAHINNNNNRSDAVIANVTNSINGPMSSSSVAGVGVISSSIVTGNALSKSAFDDLNDSIRVAMGGSPSKMMSSIPSMGAPMAVQQNQQQHQQQQQYQQQQQFNASGIGAQPELFSSPAKQQIVGGFDALGDVLKPGPAMGGAGSNQTNSGIATGQQQQTQLSQQTTTGKVLTGDLDSSLASLAENLTINKSASSQMKGVNWNSPKNTAKPGSAQWTPQPMAATTGAGYRPMAQGMTVCPSPSTIHHPLVHAPYPVMTTYIQAMPQMRPVMGGPMGGGPPMMATGMMSMNMQQQQQPQVGMMAGQPQQQQQPMMPQTNSAVQPANTNVQLDPFGAL